jgi:hypothetical protein
VREEKKFTVSKLDAAKRQLDCAIRLWFLDGDPVSIHTLVGAAYQIIHDINKKKGGKDILFDADVIKDEHRKEVRDWMRKDFMFFKHADNDMDGVTEFVPLASLMFMMVAIQNLRTLGERQTDHQLAFSIYMAITKPQWINEEYRRVFVSRLPIEHLADVRRMEKHEYLELSLSATAALRAQGRL